MLWCNTFRDGPSDQRLFVEIVGASVAIRLVEDLIAGRGPTFQARPGGASGEVSAGQGVAASTATQSRGPTRPVDAGNCSRCVHLNRTGPGAVVVGVLRPLCGVCVVPCVGRSWRGWGQDSRGGSGALVSGGLPRGLSVSAGVDRVPPKSD